MKKIILISLTIVLVGMIFFSGFFIKKEYLTASVYFIADYFKTDLSKENFSLKQENENLKAQLQKFQIFDFQNKQQKDSIQYIRADIFSTYPFNVRDFLTIDRGSDDGIIKGQAAVWGEAIFIGQVSNVSAKTASVRTVFDPNWQLPVKIGENKINGLFKGGNDPRVTLIEKPVRAGDAVFLSSKEFPLGLKIGEIKEIREDVGGIFKEASIQMPYNISELESVSLIR